MTPDELTAQLDAFSDVELLPATFRITVEQIYMPLAAAVAACAERLGRSCVVGLCGPQGSGKSTGTEVMRLLLEAKGLKVAILSLDDLYLTRSDRNRLAATVHPLLVTRGPPGTHDVALGNALLDQLTDAREVTLPSFDKAADDRRGPEYLQTFHGPANVIIFEGWCVGARPESAEALLDAVNELERDRDPKGIWRTFVNDALVGYQSLFSRIDFQILLQPASFDVVARWRREQEAKLRARTKGSSSRRFVMSDRDVDRFVQHFERLTRHIIREMPGRAQAVVELGSERELTRLDLTLPWLH